MKVYAVKKGFKTGIFDNWPDCQAATKGYSNPEYKSFETKEEAQAYIEGVDLWKNKFLSCVLMGISLLLQMGATMKR